MGRSRRRTWGWRGRSRRRRTSSVGGRIAGRMRLGRTASSWSVCCRSTRTRDCPRAPSWSRPTPTSARRRCRCWATSRRRTGARRSGRTFALALVKGGRDRIGQRVVAPLAGRPDDRGGDRQFGPVRPGEPATRWGARGVTATSAGLPARSPLEGVGLPARVRELPFLAQVDLRADPTDAAPDGAADRGAIGARPPTEPNTAVVSDDGTRHVLWLGPDEWLILGEPGSGPAWSARSAPRSARDVARSSTCRPTGRRCRSAGRERASCSPSGARWTSTNAGSSRAAAPRPCWRGRTWSSCRSGRRRSRAFRVLVRPSFAAYLAAWLTDAAVGLD